MGELTPEMMQYLLGAVIALSAGGVIFFIANPYLTGEVARDKRIQGVTENKAKRGAARARDEEVSNRRKAVADTLKEIEDRQKAKEKVTLRLKLQRAGLDITQKAYWIASMVAGVLIGIVTFFSTPGMTPLVSLAAAFFGAFGLPPWVLSFLTKRRQAKFTGEFANAIDVIVRGVKSGLPLNECLGIIARESPSPIREEFAELVEQTRVGVTLTECFDRMMARMPLPEVKFFAIVISIQQQAGGNLSEALGNLSGVLRDRKRMALKVKALSAEAKASAAVLGSLPFIVMTMVYITTPHYILLLFTTKMGQFLLLAAGAWMSCGLLVMRKMINFKY
ncbi:MAG: type II secretion system F family protein [Hyphomicrobiaceae bacterium]|nr:type II secretion system F family protein [Hyphomicrobiaceae bacterium]